MNKQEFHKIDLQNWERYTHFYYFSKMTNVGFDLTIEIDITNLLKETKKRNIKFYPAYLYVITTCLNRYKELKIAYDEDELGYWNTLTPFYAIFHDDNKTFSSIWTEYDEDFSIFYENYLADVKEYGKNYGFLAKPNPPKNCYTVSCLPWISFKSFTVHNHGLENYFFPTVEAGKYYQKDEKILLPLSITVHHSTTDGYHVSCFIDDIQKMCFDTKIWLY